MAGAARISSVAQRVGIIAPTPQALIDANIKRGAKVTVRPGEPVFVFIQTRMGSKGRIAGLSRSSPFKIAPSAAPPGVPVPRTMGRWFQISLKPTARQGQTDQVSLVTRAVVLGPPKEEKKPFTLVAGGRRFF